LNELSNGEEGGRIIQKLISERVEYEILRTATSSPELYGDCTDIRVSVADPVEESSVPGICVQLT